MLPPKTNAQDYMGGAQLPRMMSTNSIAKSSTGTKPIATTSQKPPKTNPTITAIPISKKPSIRNVSKTELSTEKNLTTQDNSLTQRATRQQSQKNSTTVPTSAPRANAPSSKSVMPSVIPQKQKLASALPTSKKNVAQQSQTNTVSQLPKGQTQAATDYIKEWGSYEFGAKDDAVKYAARLEKSEGGKWVAEQLRSKQWRAHKISQQSQAFAGGAAGFEKDENGDITFDVNKAFLGMAGMVGAQRLPRAELLKRLRTSLPNKTKDELADFVSVVKGGKVKTSKDGYLQFTSKADEQAFDAGLRLVTDKPLLRDRLSQATPGRIADLFDEVLTVR